MHVHCNNRVNSIICMICILWYGTVCSFIMSGFSFLSLFFVTIQFDSRQIKEIQKSQMLFSWMLQTLWWWMWHHPVDMVRLFMMLKFPPLRTETLISLKVFFFHGLCWFLLLFFFILLTLSILTLIFLFSSVLMWSWRQLCLCFPELKVSHVTTGWQEKATLSPPWLALLVYWKGWHHTLEVAAHILKPSPVINHPGDDAYSEEVCFRYFIFKVHSDRNHGQQKCGEKTVIFYLNLWITCCSVIIPPFYRTLSRLLWK